MTPIISNCASDLLQLRCPRPMSDCVVCWFQYVAAFAVSALAANWERLGKPFNPLLGETYELERDEFRQVLINILSFY